MMKLRCLIVDDEPIARQIVESYCAHFPELTILGSCGDALGARRILETEAIDLIFLDINMPVLDGMAFIKTLKQSPQVIFTTAYKEFAHEAFDVAACDYLLKPFSLDRFMMAVDRVKEKLQEPSTIPDDTDEEPFTFIKSDGRIHKLVFDKLLYGEAKGNNVLIVTEQEEFLTTMTLTNFEVLLPAADFRQVHRSFIINKNKISHLQGNRVFINDFEIPIGSKYREVFFREIGVR